MVNLICQMLQEIEVGFDYRRYLNSNNFYGSIVVQSFSKITSDFSIIKLVYDAQNYINNTLQKYLSKDFSGILSGMIIGEISNISDEIKGNFQDVGITHLLAVSGSNVATVILFSNYLVVRLFGKKYSDYISVLFISFFVLIAGASPSVVRAGAMAILNIFSNVFCRKTDSINNLFVASFFILIYNPITLINIGFLLSVAGTVGIIFLSKDIKRILDKYIKINAITEIISLNISAQIMILPITLYFFNSFSLIGIFANLLIIPVCSILTFLGISLLIFAIFSPCFSKIISSIINIITNYILFITHNLSKCKFLNLKLPTPKIWMIVMFYVILFLMYDVSKTKNYLLEVSETKKNILKRKILKNGYILTCILAFFSIIIGGIPKNYTELTAIDVGQGDSFLITTEKGKKILIDGGGSETTDYNVGENILMPYILDRGFKKIDYIFISHAHADHIDGIYTVLENFKVGKILISTQMNDDEKILRLKELAQENKIPIIQVFEGDKIKIEDLELEILHPSKDFIDNNVNNLSMVIKLTCNGRKILFTGDAEKGVEEQLLKKYRDNLDVDILKVGHHGAKTSSSEEFLKAVSPTISIISVAKENVYGHPSSEVIDRLIKSGKIVQTCDCGEINFQIFNNGDIKIKRKFE